VYIKGRCIVSACALLLVQQAMAAGMDCTKAANAAENTVCAGKGLYEQDVQMGSVYRALIKASAQVQPELKRTQRLWLKARNECADDVSCLNQRYDERLKVLQALLTEALAYPPDDLDTQVMHELSNSIQAASKDNPEFALERTLEAFGIRAGKTSFSGDVDKDDPSDTHFPKSKPAGLTPDEWQALRTSDISGAADFGHSTYTLLDMDDDGQRDLIVDTYTGGTGLFTYTETWRRTGERFIKRSPAAESSLFHTNDRGANQSANWINIRGKVYAAYRSGAYGVDQLYLLNPLRINNRVPTIAVHYRYDLKVPTLQHKEDGTTTYELEPALQQTLDRAISKATQAGEVSSANTPLCPVPASGAGENDYYSYGMAPYTLEVVTNLGVVIGNDCYIGALINWFGSYYEKEGLSAQLVLRKPDAEATGRSYDVNGKRHVSAVSAALGKVETDDGA